MSCLLGGTNRPSQRSAALACVCVSCLRHCQGPTNCLGGCSCLLHSRCKQSPIAFVYASTVESKVAFLRGCGVIGCCARGCRCRPGIDGGIKSRVLQEESRGSAPGSVREDRSRCVITEVAAEPENLVGSSGGSQMPLWSACNQLSRSSVGRGARQEALAAAYRRWCQRSPLFGLLHV